MTSASILDIAIFLPLATGLLVLLIPGKRVRAIRGLSLLGSSITLILIAALWASFDATTSGLQHRTAVPWIPAIGASYDVAVDGLSLPLLAVTGLLFLLVAVYTLGQSDRARSHAFLFLLMETGLLGVFSAQDLLLFYVFFEIALVPMYFVIGGWGHRDRRYAALKFFLYTRAGSLAMLLSFLALYLSMDPHTFSLPAIAATRPLAGAYPVAGLVMLGMLLGFGVKIPTVPIHNWLPDAHVEAPTEGSVILAGLQLKMGGYGLLRVLLPTVPQAAGRWAWVLVALGIASILYGVLAALAQRDLKRLIAYTSISHMGYVTLAAGIAMLAGNASIGRLALDGAVYQMVSHALLTGGMFFMAGMLDEHAGTREISRFGGLLGRRPGWSAVLAVLAFGSLGIPGMSGFVAELQVIGATVSVSGWAAALTVLGLIVTTGLYLLVVTRMLMGEPPADMPWFVRPPARELGVAGILAATSIALGVLPWPVLSIIDQATRAMAPWGMG